MRAQEFVTERKKRRGKKSSRHGGYFFPGYAYYGSSGDSGEGGGDGGGESRSGMAESNAKKQAVRRIQKMLNDRFDANLDIDGVLGPLTQKSINRFMPRARPGSADEPNKTTAVQGKKVKTNTVAEGAVEDLEKDLDDPKSYSAIDHMMQTIARDHGITGRQLHDKFVAKHGTIPDRWTRDQLRELNFLGSECTKDCSGHRAGYEWSKRRGLRQANSWSPSFNKGAGLAVAGK